MSRGGKISFIATRLTFARWFSSARFCTMFLKNCFFLFGVNIKAISRGLKFLVFLSESVTWDAKELSISFRNYSQGY